jgi:hypothetical protein
LFSTVLPAVFEMRDFLATWPALRRRWSHGPRVRLPRAAAISCALGAGWLPLIPLFPDPLFFATWVAPLALLGGALGLARVPTPFDPLRAGDWSPVLLLAFAALACGFCWESWNFFTRQHWTFGRALPRPFPRFRLAGRRLRGLSAIGPSAACFWLA